MAKPIVNRMKQVVRTPVFKQRIVPDKQKQETASLVRLECPCCTAAIVDYLTPYEAENFVCENCGSSGLSIAS